MKSHKKVFLIGLFAVTTIYAMDSEVLQERAVTNLQKFNDECRIQEEKFVREYRKYPVEGVYAGNKFYEDFVHNNIGVVFTGVYSRRHENKMWNPTIRRFVRTDKEYNLSSLSFFVDECIQMQSMFDHLVGRQAAISSGVKKRKIMSEYKQSAHRTQEALLYDDLDEIKNCIDRAKSYNQKGLLLGLCDLFASRSLSVPGIHTKSERFKKFFYDIPNDVNKVSFQLFLEESKNDELL